MTERPTPHHAPPARADELAGTPPASPLRRRFWESLAWRLTLAFVALAVLAGLVVGLVSYSYTRSEFDRLLSFQARGKIEGAIRDYLHTHPSVDGFTFKRPRDQSGPGPILLPDDGPFLVLNTQYRTVYATRQRPQGTTVTPDEQRLALPVMLRDAPVAYLLPTGARPRPDERSAEFLNRTARAIGLITLGVVLAAILLGVLVSRTLLGPMRTLLGGIRAMQRGETPVPPERVQRDEFGEVLSAFGEMSQQVARNQQARRQLTADIAHDIHTPLSVIGGTLEGMLDGTFTPTPERLARLHRETGHVTRLVNDLRFLSLADAGELRLDRQPTEVAPLVAEAVDGLRELAGRSGVTLRVQLPDPALTATLDATRTVRVIQNLVGNALEHTPAGGQVTVAARQAGPNLRLTVQDSGQGIAPEQLGLVFSRLYRADSARSEGGSGLGLSISKALVEAHGGRIWIESELGRGTLVGFELPLGEGSPVASHPSPGRPSPG